MERLIMSCQVCTVAQHRLLLLLSPGSSYLVSITRQRRPAATATISSQRDTERVVGSASAWMSGAALPFFFHLCFTIAAAAATVVAVVATASRSQLLRICYLATPSKSCPKTRALPTSLNLFQPKPSLTAYDRRLCFGTIKLRVGFNCCCCFVFWSQTVCWRRHGPGTPATASCKRQVSTAKCQPLAPEPVYGV